MGLFSSVLHVRGVEREKFLPALDKILKKSRFKRSETIPIGAKGPNDLPGHDQAGNTGPYYFVSPLIGDWLTLIEAHFALEGAPQLAELGKQISRDLSTYALALIVHDDDVLFYNLEHNGDSLDGYNSCPDYFGLEDDSDEPIEEQRHQPDAFAPLVSSPQTLSDLKVLLNRGWWNEHDGKKPEEDGSGADDEEGFVFEGERMTTIGTLLNLHGSPGEYPYAAWGEPSSKIAWPTFVAIRFLPE